MDELDPDVDVDVDVKPTKEQLERPQDRDKPFVDDLTRTDGTLAFM